MPATYDKIMTYTAPSSQASYTFTAIPSTYTDLILQFDGALTTLEDYMVIRVGNGSIDSGSNYSHTSLYGNGTNALSQRTSNATYFFQPEPMNSNRNNSTIHFQNYSNTSTNKTILMRSNTPQSSAGVVGTTTAEVALWRSTAAINQIRLLFFASGTFATGSTFTLYGIKAA
jgi:hypothetical protein